RRGCAALWGCDGAIEADIGRVIAGNDLPRGVNGDGGLEWRQFVQRPPAVVECHPRQRLITPRRVALRAASAAAFVFNHDTQQSADVVIDARRRGGQLLHRRATLGCVLLSPETTHSSE